MSLFVMSCNLNEVANDPAAMRGACGKEEHIIAVEILEIYTTPRQNGSSVCCR